MRKEGDRMKARIYAYERDLLDAVLAVLGKDRMTEGLLNHLRDSPEALALLPAIKPDQWSHLFLDALDETTLRSLLPQPPGWQAIRQLLMQASPPEVTLEKIFLSDPPLTSSLVIFEEDARRYLNQLTLDQRIVHWEDTAQASYPSLQWLLSLWPLREKFQQQDLQGYVQRRGGFGTYHLRVPKSPDPYLLTGINDRSGKTVYSYEESLHGVAILNFVLEPGEALLIWVRDATEQQRIVATARLRHVINLTIDDADGIVIHSSSSSGAILSP